MEDQQERAEPEAVVYYVGDLDTRLVKIGTTRNLYSRMFRLCSTGTRRSLLATEPGSYELESQRHDQFKRLRCGGSEWFLRGQSLQVLISDIRSSYGILNVGSTPCRPYLISTLTTARNAFASGCIEFHEFINPTGK